jgi:hypothetical protein
MGVNGGEDKVGVEGSEVEESRSGVKGPRYLSNGVTGGEEKVGDDIEMSSLKIKLFEFDFKGVNGGEGSVGVSGSPDSSKATLPLAPNFIISRVS